MTALEQLVARLVADEQLTGATLSRPRRSDPARAAKITVAPVLLQGALQYQWTYHHSEPDDRREPRRGRDGAEAHAPAGR